MNFSESDLFRSNHETDFPKYSLLVLILFVQDTLHILVYSPDCEALKRIFYLLYE
jgi:hypothetical protein